MKKILFILFIVPFFNSCSVKSKILRDINNYRTQVAYTATYNTELDTLFTTLKTILKAENRIEYASKSMRIINTESTEIINLDNVRSTKTWIEARINGADKPYRIEIKAYIKEIAYTNVAGLSFEEKRNRELESRILIKLYEEIKGKIELNMPLKTRIEDYNNDTKKEKQKIYY